MAEDKAVEQVPEDVPHLVIELSGDQGVFRAYPEANSFLLVKYLDDVTVTGFATVRAVTKIALGQVLPEEVGRLERYLEQHGHDDDYTQAVWDALSKCWAGETLLPLARSSDSSGTTSTPPTDS